MAEGGEEQAIPARLVKESFTLLQMELRAQGLTRQIRDFNGEGSRRMREWLKDIERVATALHGDDERLIALALQTVRGTAADYMSRVLGDTPGVSWDALKALFKAQFSEDSDSHIAMLKLRRIHQLKGEGIQAFGERIQSQGEAAYPNENKDNPIIQMTLVEALVDGVSDNEVAKKLIRERPTTLKRALLLAVSEQRNARAFEARRGGHEPMEVDVTHSPDNSSHLQAIKQLAQQVSVIADKVNKMTTSGQPLQSGEGTGAPNNWSRGRQWTPRGAGGQREAANYQGPSLHSQQATGRRPEINTLPQWTPDGKPICFFCQGVGHYKRDCRKLQNTQARRQASN